MLEIIDYDIEGAAYRDGVVVDGAYLLATVRRLATVSDEPRVEDRRVLTPAGDPTRIRIPLEDLDATERTALLAAFGTLEALVLRHSTDHWVAQGAYPAALDAKIAAAARAAKEHEDHKRAIEAKRQELTALDAELAAKRAERE